MSLVQHPAYPSNVSTSTSSTSPSSKPVLPPHTSSSSTTITTPSSSSSAVVIEHHLPNLEKYIKSLDQNLPQTNMNCQLSSLEGDHKKFILSLCHNTLNNCSDSKNHHQSSQIKQLREHDLAIADW
ncbi:hypothetical protein BY996DRAFT_6446743 [Phakopsora pachyrhizi]|nr:hypothetical protein BY996DRAFT_6446743 [Phakopsora pachyrhizi]